MNAIKLTNVTKRFDEFVAVNNLSMEVSKGSIFGLLGPNGAGKTTTIRMIVNIFGPDEGDIEVLGQGVNSELQQKIGYLPEERGLYKKMKIGEQLQFFAELKGVKGKDNKSRVDSWLERLELSEWKEKKAIELSKGMQQKIQFIAAVLHDPELMILDEPFTGLDPVSVAVLKTEILNLKEKGKTIIFSTHQMEQVEQICDDICLIDHGRRVLGGNIREVKASFGRNTIRIAFDGDDSFIRAGFARSINTYPNYTEMVLDEGVDSQEILKAAMTAGVRVNRFELVEPSLNDIFIDTVKGKDEKYSNSHQA